MKSKLNRDEIVSEYYEKYFNDLCNTGIQGLGTKLFHQQLESYWKAKPKKILEVGAGTGEHLKYVSNPEDTVQEYVCLDVRKSANSNHVKIPNSSSVAKWVEGSVNAIPFLEGYFDRVTSTCLFHHLVDPLEALREIRRVTERNGEIAIALPTDPGILNGVVKKFITYPKARRLGIENPSFLYALEHRNQISGLISIAKEVFKEDRIKFHYWPLSIPSVNLNLTVFIHITKHS